MAAFRRLAGLAAALAALAGVFATPVGSTTGAVCPAGAVCVSDDAGLATAVRAARAGTTIVVAPGVYRRPLTLAGSGRAGSPIRLVATGAVLDGGDPASGNGVTITGSWWVVDGLTVTQFRKGVVVDRGTDNRLERLTVRAIGTEGVRLRNNASRNVVSRSAIADTGRIDPGTGEGVYIGTAVSQWVRGVPDRSDENRIESSMFGPDVRAEAIDVKEGTAGGTIVGNVFDARGLSGANFADSWINVKGSRWSIVRNHGTGGGALRDGLQVHEVRVAPGSPIAVAGSGRDNRFVGNTGTVGAPGFGIRVDPIRTGDTLATVVLGDNCFVAAASGTTNVPLALPIVC